MIEQKLKFVVYRSRKGYTFVREARLAAVLNIMYILWKFRVLLFEKRNKFSRTHQSKISSKQEVVRVHIPLRRVAAVLGIIYILAEVKSSAL